MHKFADSIVIIIIGYIIGSTFCPFASVCHDDTDSGADYWLFLRQGLAGGLRPDKFAQCILEQ